ncbi:MAG: choice-of-anchor L domain-containing protein [Bacteroidales bacterium]
MQWQRILLFFLFICNIETFAQLSVTPGSALSLTPTQFVQNNLVGTGITILPGATFNGSALLLNSGIRPLLQQNQIGSFTTQGGAAAQLGIDGGVILSSGKVQNAIAGAPTSNFANGGSDPDLYILAATDIFDKSVLEFDFIPETDLMNFRYVFSSVEFDTYCLQSFNDAFGLFLSGSGISGGMGFQNDAVNIAMLPDGSSFVNIHNICQADYENLGIGKYSWWNPEPRVYFSHHRFTFVYTASYPVTCGQTYHMKFAIGDAGDSGWDSDVFLEQNSFSSSSFTPETEFSNPQTGDLLVPGCSDVNLSYSISQPKLNDLIIDLIIDPTGTATQADILPNPFPAQVTIPAGQTQSTVIHLSALPIAVPGPDKLLVIKASATTCAILNSVTNNFSIKYNSPLSVDAPPFISCAGETPVLTATATGGQTFITSDDYHFLWSNGSTLSSISVNPGPGHHPYTVTVTDACNQALVVPTWVNVGTSPGPASAITGDSPICTPATGLAFSVDPIPGADDYLWSLPAGATITAGNNTNAILVNFGTNASSGNISVSGHSTYCGDGTGMVLPLVINPSPQPAGPITGVASVCQGTAITDYSIEPLSFITTYEWSVPQGVTVVSGSGTNTISCIFTSTAISGDFTVRGYNPDCIYGSSSSLYVTIKPLPANPGVISSANGSVVCQKGSGVVYSIPVISDASEYIWEFSGSGATLTPNGTTLNIDFSPAATSGVLTVKGRNSCGDGLVSAPFIITVKPKPTVIFSVCNSIITTKNGRPIVLKGGSPIGATGVYSGPGVSMVNPELYFFDPSNNSVIGGGVFNGVSNQVFYRYTNSQGCSDVQSMAISVFGSNANEPCPGVVKDHRDNNTYPTFLVGTGTNERCWMASNLNFGTLANQETIQTDNCINEKYCPGNVESGCALSGGYYQWNEIMEYQAGNNFQDICPGGWHIPSSQEWQEMIDEIARRSPGDGLAGSQLTDPNLLTGFHALLLGFYYMNHTWAFSPNTASFNAAMFWTSTLSNNKPLAHGLNRITQSVSRYESSNINAFQLRCIKNQ